MCKTSKEELVGPAEKIGFYEIEQAADLTIFFDQDCDCVNQKFLVITGHTPGAFFWNAAFAHFLLVPVAGLTPDDAWYHTHLLKAFINRKGRFNEVRRQMSEACFLDQRGYRWCVEGGGMLYLRGDRLIATEESGDFGPFFRARVQYLLRGFATRIGKRSLVLGGSDGGNRVHPIRSFKL